jgi:predicted DNA-binding WGR domain protein
MDNLLTIAFEAHSQEANHHRRYQITVGRDLLDDWTVAIRYGRSGQAGRELRYAASKAEAMQAVIRDRLRRRLSAPKRIGCPYRLIALNAAPGFDSLAWLPGEVMARFFQAG